MRQKRRVKKGRLIAVCLLAIAVMITGGCSVYLATRLFQKDTATETKKNTKTEKKQNTEKTSSFTFAGVGDNLLHDVIFADYMYGDTDFDFDQYYELMKKYIEPVDLAYINQETICAGDDYGLSGYPTFNGPTQLLDATIDTGFDWLATSSNHSLDKGADALLAQLDYLDEKYPKVSVTGTHRSEEESQEYVVRDVNGIKVGLLGYTYGTNGIPVPEDKPWIVDLIDEEKIEKDVKEISKISDVQIVSMHWGTEYHTEIEPDQEELAKKMNEWGVEVIIGTHPHVIKPAEIIQGEKQDTLCYYSLGNFLSAQDTNDRMVGGMASFTLNYDFEKEKTTFDKVQFIPTVTYFDPYLSNFKVMTIHEYNNEYAQGHHITAMGYDMTKEWIQEYVQQVMQEPEGIEVVLES